MRIRMGHTGEVGRTVPAGIGRARGKDPIQIVLIGPKFAAQWQFLR